MKVSIIKFSHPIPSQHLPKGYEALYNLFTRKTFKIGGSLAIRIPKEIANVIGLKEGSDVKLAVMEKKIIIEPA